MSTLRNRILSYGTRSYPRHPYGTGATPMTTPVDFVTYDGQAITSMAAHPVWAPDGGVLTAYSESQVQTPAAAPVIPAGKP